MKKALRVNIGMSIGCLLLTGLLCAAFAGEASGNENVLDGADKKETAQLVLQDLNYTENPVDIPNPDRGFERGNDDAAGLGAFIPDKPGGSNYWGYMTVPASPNTILGQPFEMAY
ncbi:MAG: hypothetical protein K9N46_08755, partial [Candidatus Marinimicrobia bacterium]|nr:hypothetical protein [Candidatus Neomarinimicrobiota bacterium]MCF7830196.1 hypothetical protein [Candidatus Neomarinimicrobiota bacterium]MCF7880813.1 hypothetical protein [Candidatus Neomarinimicrobiota bacterium]